MIQPPAPVGRARAFPIGLVVLVMLVGAALILVQVLWLQVLGAAMVLGALASPVARLMLENKDTKTSYATDEQDQERDVGRGNRWSIEQEILQSLTDERMRPLEEGVDSHAPSWTRIQPTVTIRGNQYVWIHTEGWIEVASDIGRLFEAADRLRNDPDLRRIRHIGVERALRAEPQGGVTGVARQPGSPGYMPPGNWPRESGGPL